MANNPIRILQVVPSLNRSAGVARVVYNWNRFHDENRVHFDFLHHSSRNGVLLHNKRYDEELKAVGSEVLRLIMLQMTLNDLYVRCMKYLKRSARTMTLYIAICRTLRSVSFEKLNWSV